MENWEHLLVVKKRDDERAFKDVVFKKRRFSNLMKRRPIMEHKKYYDNLIEDPKTQAFTLTFNQQLRDIYDETILRDIAKDIMEFFPIKKYLLYPDIDLNGNFHYHGVINMLTKDKPKMARYTKLYSGYIKFKYITDPEKWYKYMRGTEDIKDDEKLFNHPKEKIYEDGEITNYILYNN